MFQRNEIEVEFLCDFVPRVIIIRAYQVDYDRWTYEIWRQNYHAKTKTKSDFKTFCRMGVGTYSTHEAAIEAGRHDELALRSYFDRSSELRQLFKRKEISRTVYKRRQQENEMAHPVTLQAYAAAHA